MHTIADRFSHINKHIELLVKENHKISSNITLIAVSKRQEEEKIRQALAYGHRVFGENKVQEAQQKWPKLIQEYPDTNLHLIGSLQTNKVKEALTLFNVIHTVDRPKLAKKIKDTLDTLQLDRTLYIQVNTGEEEQKSGISPQELDEFIAYCIHELALPVKGLMCIPPVDELPAPHFSLLKKYADKYSLPHLSMGMSDDYPIAIAMGATHIRVGTKLFGPRE